MQWLPRLWYWNMLKSWAWMYPCQVKIAPLVEACACARWKSIFSWSSKSPNSRMHQRAWFEVNALDCADISAPARGSKFRDQAGQLSAALHAKFFLVADWKGPADEVLCWWCRGCSHDAFQCVASWPPDRHIQRCRQEEAATSSWGRKKQQHSGHGMKATRAMTRQTRLRLKPFRWDPSLRKKWWKRGWRMSSFVSFFLNVSSCFPFAEQTYQARPRLQFILGQSLALTCIDNRGILWLRNWLWVSWGLRLPGACLLDGCLWVGACSISWCWWLFWWVCPLCPVRGH